MHEIDSPASSVPLANTASMPTANTRTDADALNVGDSAPPTDDLSRLIPRKFLDESGNLRVDALLKSYLELEKRLSSAGKADPREAPPATADDYAICCDHGLFAADPALNAQLHASGFSQKQAQLLYDLAAERLVPMLRDMESDMLADRELQRLVTHFGGPESWDRMSGQILAWARGNLPEAVIDALARTADGVIALQKLMGGNEPATLSGTVVAENSSGDLRRLVADPRYWRDRDPAFVARVTEGFRRNYGS